MLKNRYHFHFLLKLRFMRVSRVLSSIPNIILHPIEKVNHPKRKSLISRTARKKHFGENDIVVKLTYTERIVSEPLISAVTRKFGVLLNIVFADVDIVQGAPIGGTVAVISREREKITEAVKYLIEKNVAVEVVKRGTSE
ncbi:MAG: hypothetical protein K2J77_07530 [Oscillospiraceae bacterium]|nr:hypothetical protein [Oscillospiraceae bacterium]